MKTVLKSSTFTILLLCTIFLSGCYLQQNVQIEDPMAATSCYGTDGSLITIPVAKNDPEFKQPVGEKKLTGKKYLRMVPAKAENITIPPPEKQPGTASSPAKEQNKENKAANSILAGQTESQMSLVSKPRIPEHFLRGPVMWRAFSKMSPEEQQELIKLQRTSPERFRDVMQEKVRRLYEQEKIHQQELEKLAVQYRSSQDEKTKNAIKAELHKKIKAEFEQRLHDTRRDIEAHKRRTARLEAELVKREKNCDAIINILVERRLTVEKSADKKTNIEEKK